MMDLYRRIGLATLVDDPTIIRQQIEISEDGAAVAAARQILLNPKRKPLYDHNHQVLTVIAQLRKQLHKSETRVWSSLASEDFFEGGGDGPGREGSVDSGPWSAIGWLLRKTTGAIRLVKELVRRDG